MVRQALSIESSKVGNRLRTMVEADNVAVFRRFYEDVWNEGNLAVADELLAEAFDKRGVVETRLAYPDWTLVIENLVAEGDRVTARWWTQGTHTGALEGISPTGKRDKFRGTTVVRVADGKIAELWKQQSEV